MRSLPPDWTVPEKSPASCGRAGLQPDAAEIISGAPGGSNKKAATAAKAAMASGILERIIARSKAYRSGHTIANLVLRYHSPVNKRNGDDLRLFIACELPEDAKQGLGRIQEGLKRDGAERLLRWVRPEGVHLTLKFLGAVPRSDVERLKNALAPAIEPFALTLRPATIGTFGGARMRVVWVGLEGDIDALAALAGRVDAAVAPLGFERERRPFAAHLTLARVRDQAGDEERRRLALQIRGYRLPALPSMTLSEVALMESRLGPGGSAYHRLAVFPEASA